MKSTEKESAVIVGRIALKPADVDAAKRRAARAAEREAAKRPFNTIRGLDVVRVPRGKRGAR